MESILSEDEYVLTVVNHPRFGVGEFTHPAAPPRGPIAQSAFVPDLAINPHPRFGSVEILFCFFMSLFFAG